MTKGDVIRCMSNKELSTFLYNHEFCPAITRCGEYIWDDNKDCKQCIEKFIEEGVRCFTVKTSNT